MTDNWAGRTSELKRETEDFICYRSIVIDEENVSGICCNLLFNCPGVVPVYGLFQELNDVSLIQGIGRASLRKGLGSGRGHQQEEESHYSCDVVVK
jgi:hypothetical protein